MMQMRLSCWSFVGVHNECHLTHLVRERRRVHEEAFEVAILHQFHHNVYGLVAVHDADQTHHEV